MSSDRIVTPQHVLASVMELQRRGSRRVLSDLESLEPDLTEHLLEGLTQLYHMLLRVGASGKEARRIYRQAESTALVCLMALRKGHADLWGSTSSPPQADAAPDPPPSPPSAS